MTAPRPSSTPPATVASVGANTGGSVMVTPLARAARIIAATHNDASASATNRSQRPCSITSPTAATVQVAPRWTAKPITAAATTAKSAAPTSTSGA